MGVVVLKQGREKSIRNQHPWIFSGAIARVEDDAQPGDIVTVIDHKGDFMARGYWNPKSQIQVRLLTWQDEEIDTDWWRRMLKRAIDARLDTEDVHWNWEHIPCRLVNAESDYLPGLVIDCYCQDNGGHWLVLQALTLGIDQRKAMITELLIEVLRGFAAFQDEWGIHGVYERSDVDVRHKEGLSPLTGVLWGKEPPDAFRFQYSEYFMIDIRKGHKTGFYLDQKDNHWILRLLIVDEMRGYRGSEPCHLLNLFSYSGAFGIFGGGLSEIKVTNVDASKEALELAEASVKANEFLDENDFEFIQADVFQYLRDIATQGQQYDVVVLDPPKFAHNKQQVEKAARGYKDINLNAFKVVKPGGYLMTFSCSGAISRDLFQKIVFGALADSGRQAQIVRHLSASDDHPVALTFPEGEYLKGLLLRVY